MIPSLCGHERIAIKLNFVELQLVIIILCSRENHLVRHIGHTVADRDVAAPSITVIGKIHRTLIDQRPVLRIAGAVVAADNGVIGAVEYPACRITARLVISCFHLEAVYSRRTHRRRYDEPAAAVTKVQVLVVIAGEKIPRPFVNEIAAVTVHINGDNSIARHQNGNGISGNGFRPA